MNKEVVMKAVSVSVSGNKFIGVCSTDTLLADNDNSEEDQVIACISA